VKADNLIPSEVCKAAKTLAEREVENVSEYNVEPWPWPASDLKRAIFPVLDADGRFVGKEEVELRPVHLLDACFEMGIRRGKKIIYVRWRNLPEAKGVRARRFSSLTKTWNRNERGETEGECPDD
jgi:hypothetical protein